MSYISEYQCKKRYKLYTVYDDVTVPRATQWRKNQADNESPSTSQICSSNETESIGDPHVQKGYLQVNPSLHDDAAFCVDQPFTNEVENLSCGTESSFENESSDNESSYDDIPPCINDIESDDDNVCCDSVAVVNSAAPNAVKPRRKMPFNMGICYKASAYDISS